MKKFNVTIAGTAFIHLDVFADTEEEAVDKVWNLPQEVVDKLIDFDWINASWDVEEGEDECSR